MIGVVLEWSGGACLLAGTALISLGTIGLIRFPDSLTRLHALTKADNVGLGFCVLGLALIGQDLKVAMLMAFVWAGVMLSGASAAYLLARRDVERLLARQKLERSDRS
jgi:multicomponent Na+:H+ antiporter subunit G